MDFYLLLVIILFALAISDLIVGVSNDAVNFLNSAIGAKAGSRLLILLVASLGILCGAMFSSGMMEVARKGIFNPEMFTFAEVMVVFTAVMPTDILLLDLFNTFGMPTSTTVSIVFELLGGATAIALIKVSKLGLDWHEAINYINTSKATQIIVGIFISVVIAFAVGAIAQFISRMIFSFNYKERVKKVGPVWGGVALSIMSYFLIIKGLKGSALISDQAMGWVQTHTGIIMALALVLWSGILYVIQQFTRLGILRLIVLAGTFSLAMAFANNDLVNFIGVPIAGFESYQSWKASAAEPQEMLMSSLKEAVRTPTYLLMLAGVIMMVTLWRSKKARSVTATQVNLSRQGEGYERFKPHLVARIIVNVFVVFGNLGERLLSHRLRARINQKYTLPQGTTNPENAPAFDMVRAAVNLTMASMLIAIATSLKLPLSTTYVSFMVAMGTSLADRAWGKESAAYRVAGVINVITGWFMTALIAFLVAGTMAVILAYLKWTGLVILLIVVVTVIFMSLRWHGKMRHEGEDD